MGAVLIVDRNGAFADALRLAIDGDPELRCIGIAETPDDAVEATRRLGPDGCLVDLDRPGGEGLAAVAMLRTMSPALALTGLTERIDAEAVRAADQAGASHLVSKKSSINDVLGALRAGHSGRMTVAGTVVVDLLGRQDERSRTTNGIDVLTTRELEVLRDMAEGTPPKVIAARMGISVHTVRGHVKSIYWKLDAHNQLEAVAIARRRGIISTAS